MSYGELLNLAILFQKIAQTKNIYDYLPKILNKIKTPIIIELGLHACEDTKKILSLVPDSIYYGFECDPRNIKIIKSKKISQKIHLIEIAVSNFNGKAKFYQADNKVSSSLQKPTEHLSNWPKVKFEKSIIVPVCTLDKFCEKNNINNIDFIWADIQGAEYNMILGAQNILKKTNYLYTEYYNKEMYKGQKNLKDILNALPGKWTIVIDFGSNVLLKNNIIKT